MSNLSAINYTPTIIANQLVSNLNTDQTQQSQLETQLSTGTLVNSPSDNPAAASSLMSLDSTLSRTQQYLTNANDGVGWLSLGTSTLNSVITTLQQAQQSVQALSGNTLTGSQAAITGTVAQLQSSMSEVLNLANTTYGNQAIFAGTGNVAQAYDSSGNYIGGGSAPTRTVAPGVTLPVAATGPAKPRPDEGWGPPQWVATAVPRPKRPGRIATGATRLARWPPQREQLSGNRRS